MLRKKKRIPRAGLKHASGGPDAAGMAEARKRVLYHAVSSYQLLEVMLHRIVYHSSEYAVLILPDFITEKYPQYRRLEKKTGRKPFALFDRVVLFPYLHIPHGSERQIAEDVRRSYDKYVGCDIRSFSDVYVAGAHFYFSLYLIEQQVPFAFFEDAAGLAGRPEILYGALSRKYPQHARIAQKHGLFDGSCPLVKEIWGLHSAQAPGDRAGMKDFCLEQELQRMDSGMRRRILRFFVKRRIWGRADAVLLTQQFAGLGLMSEQQQRQLYRKLYRQELQGIRLMIKRHPDDAVDYHEIFPKAKVLRQVFPSELLPYVLWHKPPVICTFDSTGCGNLKEHFTIKKLSWRELWNRKEF